MARRSDEDDILSLLGRKRTGLSIDDIAASVAGALKEQKRDLIQHVKRMLEVAKLHDTKSDDRTHNLHARLTAVESELRQLKRGMR